MRRERRHDVADAGVFVHVSGDPERREVAHLGGVGNRPAEHDDRRLLGRHPAKAANEVDAAAVGETQVKDHQVDRLPVAPAAPPASPGPSAGTARCPALQGRLEPVPCKAVSSAINTVLTATMVVAVTTLRIGMAWLLR